MSKEIKQKADDLVGLFRLLTSGVTTKNGVLEYLEEERNIKAVALVILHQRRLIDGCRNHFHYGTDYLEEQKEILTELKSRL